MHATVILMLSSQSKTLLSFIVLLCALCPYAAWGAGLPELAETISRKAETVSLEGELVGRWLYQGPDREQSSGAIGIEQVGGGFEFKGKARWEETPIGPALFFDGKSSLHIANAGSLLSEKAFSVTVWINAETPGSVLGVWDYPDRRSFALVIDDKRRLQFFVSADGSEAGAKRLIAEKRVEYGKWHFVAATFFEGEMTLFHSGRRTRTKAKQPTIHLSTAPLKAGSLGLKGPFIGGVQDIRLYRRALEKAETDLLAGRGTTFSVEHTLTFPDKRPKVNFHSALNLMNAYLDVELNRGRKNVYRLKIDNPPQQLSFDLVPDTLPGDGFYDLTLTLQKKGEKSPLYQETQKLFVRRAGRPHDILYFSFYTPRYGDLTAFHLKRLEDSPFTSINAPLLGAYETHQLNMADFTRSVSLIKESKKAVWPLVFTNRMVGSSKNSQFDRRNAYWKNRDIAATPFSKIKLIDLYDHQGALSAFLDTFEMALSLAKETRAPGVFIDSEAYNCHHAIKVANLSLVHMKSGEQIVKRLKGIGADMADKVNTIYPQAMLYFYAADFGITHKGCDYVERILHEASLIYEPRCFQAFGYIMLGILERAQQANYPLRVIDGELGEYTYPNMPYMKNKLTQGMIGNWKIKEQFPEHLHFSATIAPYADARVFDEQNWIKRRLTRQTIDTELKIVTIEDFELPFSYLLAANDYVWVYGAGAAGKPTGFDLFKPWVAKPYLEVLQKALSEL